MKKKNPNSAILGGVIILIAAIVVAVLGLQSPPELKNVNEIPAAEMNDDYSYYIEDLIVVDVYMTQTGGDSGNGKYYIAAFEGTDDKAYFVSIYTETDADIHDTLEDYAANDDLQIGDLLISGCFTTKTVESIEDMSFYYDRTVSSYMDYFEEELDIESVDLSLHLNYVCADSADYESEASNRIMLVVAAVFLLLGAVMLFFGIRAKKAMKADEEARARFNENQPTPEDRYQGPEF